MIGRLRVIEAVLRNPTLRRLEIAYLTWAFGGWATWVAVVVYAYGRGGAGEAGLVAFVELAPALVLAPAVASLGDRYPRAVVLLATYAAQTGFMAAAALAMAAGAPAMVVYAFATLTATTVTFSRPLHASLLPEVVTSPDDLTAANVVSGMADSVGILIGPLGAGLLIGAGGPAAVFAAAAVGNLIGCATVVGAARTARADPVRADPRALEVRRRSARDAFLDGVRAIRADPRLLGVIAIASWATFLVGALDILYAVLAIDLLGLDGGGVGFLGALGGIGAILGSAAGLVLVGRERLGVVLAASGFLFGGAIAAVSIVGPSAAVVLLMILAGMGSGLTYVGAQTMIQRLAGDDVMSRVFGVLQGLMMGSTALGALAVPLIIALVGQRPAFALAGSSLPFVVILASRAVLARDRVDPLRAADLRLLRGIPMLAPLSAPVLERLAAGVVRSSHDAGEVVIREGAPGERFFVVVDGELEVEAHGRPARRLAAGEGFGEIALIRAVPRTATVTAITTVTLIGVDREPFLGALTGQPRSRRLATILVDERLAGEPDADAAPSRSPEQA